jgi:hypothetical protein
MKNTLLSIALILTIAVQAQVLVTSAPSNHLKYYRVELAPAPNADFVFKHLQYYGKECLDNRGLDALNKTACDSLRKYNDLYEPYASDKANIIYTRAFTSYQKVHTNITDGMILNGFTTSGEYFKSLKEKQRQVYQDNMKSAETDFNAFLSAYSVIEDYRVTNVRKWMSEVKSYIVEVKK